MSFEHIVKVTGAFDRRDPDPKKNYGIHGMELRFILKGERGAMQFVVYTPIHLEHVAEELWQNHRTKNYNPFKATGADIGYHSKTPRYEEQPKMECEYTGCGHCYYDGSSLQADEFMPEFLAGGSDAVWKMLEERYNSLFS